MPDREDSARISFLARIALPVVVAGIVSRSIKLTKALAAESLGRMRIRTGSNCLGRSWRSSTSRTRAPRSGSLRAGVSF